MILIRLTTNYELRSTEIRNYPFKKTSIKYEISTNCKLLQRL